MSGKIVLVYAIYQEFPFFTEKVLKRKLTRAAAGGGGRAPETGKISVKMVLFSRAVESNKVPGVRNGKLVKSLISIAIFVCKFKKFQKISISIGLLPKRAKVCR